MNDFIFVVKCFAYTVLIAFLMQIKVSGISIEGRVEQFLKSSQVTAYLQDAAAGGASLVQDGYHHTKSFVMDSTKSFRSSNESHERRASR